MQRQSLGSSGSKIRLSGGGGATEKAEQQQLEEEEEIKAEKQIRWSLRSERSIHLIPVLTLLCLLVLFLLSDDPSPKDLEAFSGGEILQYDTRAASVEGRTSAINGNRGLKAAAAVVVRNRKLGIAQAKLRT